MNAETMKKVATTVGKIVVYGALLGLSSATKSNITRTEVRSSDNYYEVVREITASNMLDCTKRECINSMKRDEDSGYYMAVSDILRSNMLDSSKISMIKSL